MMELDQVFDKRRAKTRVRERERERLEIERERERGGCKKPRKS